MPLRRVKRLVQLSLSEIAKRLRPCGVRLQRLDTIPVAGRRAAERLLAEIGSPPSLNDAVQRIEEYIEARARHFILNWTREPRDVRTQMELAVNRIVPHFRR